MSFRRGDPNAFEAIIQHYQGYVFAIILNMVNQDEAPDIAQEVFLQLYRSLPRFESNNLKAWIGKIAVHKTIDWKRSHTGTNEDSSDIDINTVKDNNMMPDEIVITQEKQRQVQTICRNLPPRYRRVIIKYYFENKTYQQIAREEGVSLRTIESRLYRAKHMIRSQWKEEQG